MCYAVLSHSVMSDSLQPHRLHPARLLCPWGFSRQEYLSGLPCPPPGESSQPRDQTQVSHIAGILYQLSHQGSPQISSEYLRLKDDLGFKDH